MSSDDVNLDDLELELRRIPGVRAAGFSQRDDLLLIELHVTGPTTTANLPVVASRIAFRHTHKPVALELVRWRDRPTGLGAESSTGAGPGTGAGTSTAGSGAETPEGAAAHGVPPVGIPESAPPTDVSPAEIRPGEPEAGTTPDVSPETPAALDGTRAASVITVGEDAQVGAPTRPEARVRLLAVLTFPDTDELEVHLTHLGRRSIGRAKASDGLLASVSATLDGLHQLVPGLEVAASWVRTMDHGTTVPPALVACELRTADGGLRNGLASGASVLEAAARSTLHALNRTVTRGLDAPDA